MPVLASELALVITQGKTHGGEEVAFARAIATDDDIALGREGLNESLVLVAETR